MPRPQIAPRIFAVKNGPRMNSYVTRLYWLRNRAITGPVEKCANCGKPLRRVPRTFFQQFGYSAAYQCPECGNQEFEPRPYRFHFGPHARCPQCGTVRLERHKRRDPVDPVRWSLLTVLEWLLGGKLCHCNFCRIQFYDRRNLGPDASRSA